MGICMSHVPLTRRGKPLLIGYLEHGETCGHTHGRCNTVCALLHYTTRLRSCSGGYTTLCGGLSLCSCVVASKRVAGNLLCSSDANSWGGGGGGEGERCL